jgi:hypothetical protein
VHELKVLLLVVLKLVKSSPAIGITKACFALFVLDEMIVVLFRSVIPVGDGMCFQIMAELGLCFGNLLVLCLDLVDVLVQCFDLRLFRSDFVAVALEKSFDI